jgi:Domain of unknown function (DUF4383)
MNRLRSGTGTRLDHLHRVGAVVFGLGLAGFGLLGLIHGLDMFTTRGESVLGLSSNGLLSVISVVVGAVLVAAGALGGRIASTLLVVIGSAFVLSGFVNALVLDTPLNLLAFRIPNVIFSFVAGALLLFLGAWGRYAGHLPDDNQYYRERHSHDELAPLPARFSDPADAAAARDLAEAERAYAQHVAPPELTAEIDALHQIRREEDRVRQWRLRHG